MPSCITANLKAEKKGEIRIGFLPFLKRKLLGTSKNSIGEQAARGGRQMIQFFERVVELREEKTVIYDGKITVDLPSRGFLEVPYRILAGKRTHAQP